MRHGRYVTLGLVEQQIDVAFFALQQLAVNLNMVAFDVGFAAELGDGLAVHAHAALRDQLFGLAPRRNPRGRDDLLQSLRRHSQPPVLSEAICPATCSSVLLCSGSEDTVGSVTFSGTSALSSSICSTPPSSPGVPVASATAPSPAAKSSSCISPAASFSNSSRLGSSVRSRNPKRIRKSLVVLYSIGRPTTAFLPAVVMSLCSSSVPITPAASTPRMSLISGTVTGCL